MAEERAVDLQQLSEDWAQSVAHWATSEISTGGSYELGGAQHQLNPRRGLWTVDNGSVARTYNNLFFQFFIYTQRALDQRYGRVHNPRSTAPGRKR